MIMVSSVFVMRNVVVMLMSRFMFGFDWCMVGGGVGWIKEVPELTITIHLVFCLLQPQ